MLVKPCVWSFVEFCSKFYELLVISALKFQIFWNVSFVELRQHSVVKRQPLESCSRIRYSLCQWTNCLCTESPSSSLCRKQNCCILYSDGQLFYFELVGMTDIGHICWVWRGSPATRWTSMASIAQAIAGICRICGYTIRVSSNLRSDNTLSRLMKKLCISYVRLTVCSQAANFFPMLDDVGECRRHVRWNGRPLKPRCSRWNLVSMYYRNGVKTTSGLAAAILRFRCRPMTVDIRLMSYLQHWLMIGRTVLNFYVIGVRYRVFSDG